MNELLDKLFKWDIKDLIKAIIGCFLFAFAVNIFLVPNSLYNGGILGIAQLIRSLFINVLHIKTSFDVSGIINLLLNLPLFVLDYKFISKICRVFIIIDIFYQMRKRRNRNLFFIFL